MAAKNMTLTLEDMESRIAQATRALSRKKFTEKQLKLFIINGKMHSESKRTKSGYQLFLDEFRKDLTKEERSNVGKVAKDGSAQWREMNEDAKQPYLDLAIKLKNAQNDSSDESKNTPKKNTVKKSDSDQKTKKSKKNN